jgi:hypothetical protein
MSTRRNKPPSRSDSKTLFYDYSNEKLFLKYARTGNEDILKEVVRNIRKEVEESLEEGRKRDARLRRLDR